MTLPMITAPVNTSCLNTVPEKLQLSDCWHWWVALTRGVPLRECTRVQGVQGCNLRVSTETCSTTALQAPTARHCMQQPQGLLAGGVHGRSSLCFPHGVGHTLCLHRHCVTPLGVSTQACAPRPAVAACRAAHRLQPVQAGRCLAKSGAPGRQQGARPGLIRVKNENPTHGARPEAPRSGAGAHPMRHFAWEL
jgi:hypothetical protein